ncbi:hypothetical protein AAFF_G00159520 [Aldrovandia affinis]|uniref:IRS-type PTB domain-containing protein n=1 Tax=Aldrovandia affinis TaxID=143900 RepID=A0AAD7RMW5_9TELE|nr:hypothetical protein AAFF_G00159520 [Aldrovandia affinis]
MGSCWSCLYRDTIPDNHPTKFKVTNVDDEGNELGSGTMELTQTELILHTRKRDAVRWPYLCLRRYGYDSNLFSFESGRRCQTGQGIFAFKCSRAEEIFNLLQELMQCNSINVVEEPVLITRAGHTPELDLPRTPQTPNTPAYTVQGFPNGYPGYPISADSSHPSSRQPSVADDHGHSLIGLEDQAHTYVNTANVEGETRGRHCVHSLPEVRPSPFPETTRGVAPMGGQGGGHSSMHCCPLEEHEDPQVFLQTASQEAKFMLGPTPAQRRFLEMERERHAHHHRGLEAEGVASELEAGGQPPPLPPLHLRNPHAYHHHHHHVHHRHPGSEHQDGCQLTRLTYENINGLRGGGRRGGAGRLKLCPGSLSHSGGSSSSSSGGDSHPHSLSMAHPHSHPLSHSSSLPPQAYVCERGMGALGGCHRKTALLNYENLPSLPPVWEYRALQREEEQEEEEEDEEQDEDEEYEEEDYDEYEFSEGPGTPNGYHQDGDGHHGDTLRNYVNTERMQLGPRRPACPPRRQQCPAAGAGGVFSFDFRRGTGRGSGVAVGCEHAHLPQSRQLNYIQVDLDGEPEREVMGGGEPPPQPAQHQPPPPSACPPSTRRSEFYAVIDLKKTAAMSNLQKALPRDDGTSRKTRHNSTDLPLILQLNTEGLTTSKISVIEQLAYTFKALIILLQETHCVSADKLVLPNFALAGSILSRKHGLATFIHKSEPVKRWNFRKANWKCFRLLTNKSTRHLPSPNTNSVDQAYQDFCSVLVKAAKKSIPRTCYSPVVKTRSEETRVLGGGCQYHRMESLSVLSTLASNRSSTGEQAGFRRGRSTVDQVTLLTQDIEDSFSAKKKAGAIFVNLTAAYDTVWHRGLTCKLLRLLPDRHMGSVLAPLLYNIYTYDLPDTVLRKYAYADDLALVHSAGDWQSLEGTLGQDMKTLVAYLQKWRLKLSKAKTVSAAFHLNNKEAKPNISTLRTAALALVYSTRWTCPDWRGAATSAYSGRFPAASQLCTCEHRVALLRLLDLGGEEGKATGLPVDGSQSGHRRGQLGPGLLSGAVLAASRFAWPPRQGVHVAVLLPRAVPQFKVVPL